MEVRKTLADNLVRYALAWTALLGSVLLAVQTGCADSQWSPTGHLDDGSLVPVKVSDTWEAVVFKPSQEGAKKKLENASTAVFTMYPQFSAYYDQRLKVTRLQVYGTVQTTTSYGQHMQHRYTVGWQRGGKIDPNDNEPWDPSGTTVVDTY